MDIPVDEKLPYSLDDSVGESYEDSVVRLIEKFSHKESVSAVEFETIAEVFSAFRNNYNRILENFRHTSKDKEKLQKRVHELEQKDSLYTDIQMQDNPLDALELVSDFLKESLGADRVSLWWYNKDNNRLSNHIADGITNHELFTIPLNGTLAGHSYLTNSVINIQDAYHITNEVPFKYQKRFDKKNHYQTKSVLCLPIPYIDPATGKVEQAILQLINKNRDLDSNVVGDPFTEDDVRRARGLGYTIVSGLKEQSYARELEIAEDSVYAGIAEMTDQRHPTTAGHSFRVSKLAVNLAAADGRDKQYQSLINRTGLLHDAGKIAIPDYVLSKKGRLTQKEFIIMKQHPDIGYNVVSKMHIKNKDKILGGIRHHHEKLNGTGYPLGLKGDEVPLEARILSIVDQFDALRSYREYRNPMSLEEVFAAQLISRGVCKNELDKDLVYKFIESDSYIIPEYKSYVGDSLLKMKNLFNLGENYTIGDQTIYAAFKSFLLDFEIEHSLIKENAARFGHTFNEQKEHEVVKQFLLHLIQTDKSLVPVHSDTSFALVDILDMMTSKRYTKHNVSLGDFLSKVVPQYLDTQRITSYDVLNFIRTDEWQSMKNNYHYNRGTKFTLSDLSSVDSLIKLLPDEDARKEFLDQRKYLHKTYRKQNQFSINSVVKTYFLNLFTQLSESKYPAATGSGFTFNDVYELLSRSSHLKKNYSDEQIFFLVGYDAVKKGTLPVDLLETKMDMNYTLNGSLLRSKFSNFRKFIKSRTKKSIQYSSGFFKKLNSFEKNYLIEDSLSANTICNHWYK